MKNKELHQTFVNLGHDRRKLTNQLLTLLPAIYECEIYKKYAATIVEYAGKFGGLSKGVVLKRLRLQKYLKDKPNLTAAIASEGVHKVALVASLATVEDEAAWADKLKHMSKPAVQELSKEVRWKIEKGELSLDDGANLSLFENLAEGSEKSDLCAAAPQRIKITLEGELFFLFLQLKKKYGEKLSNREVMRKIFEENLKIGEPDGMEKSQAVKKVKKDEQQKKVIPGDNFAKKKSRYVSVHLRRNLLQKTAGRCAYPACQRPAEIFHHKERFAKSHSHGSLTPLCKIHHEFAHNGLAENEQAENENWSLHLRSAELQKIDRLYRKYRLAGRS